MTGAVYRPDMSLKGKLRRRIVRLQHRRPVRAPRAARTARPMISFCFDDVTDSAFSVGAELLQDRGLRGSFFVCAGLLGETGHMGAYATRDQIVTAAAAGHEIGCHTYSHLDCAKAPAQTIIDDVARNRDAFAAWGAPPTSAFAYPYGEISLTAKRALNGRFRLLRALHPGLIETGSDLNQAPAVGVEGPRGEARALKWIDRAAKRKAWLILFTHDIADQPSPWGSTPNTLERLIQAARERAFDVVTIAEGAKRLG